MLFLGGVYSRNQYGKIVFRRTKAPDKVGLGKLINKTSQRTATYLERQGFLERDEENSYLQLDGMEEDPMQQLLGPSITYRVAVEPQQGKKVFTLQTVPATESDGNSQVAPESGYSLHAGFVAQHWERKKLERLYRYITRPAISEKRLSTTPAERRRAMSWARRLKRVFYIDVEVCSHCGGRVKVFACIEDQSVIDQILNHLNRKETWFTPMILIPEGTGPPPAQLF